jgi:hypothetical protein
MKKLALLSTLLILLLSFNVILVQAAPMPQDSPTNPQASATPIDSLEEALGTLGIFAAFMLILAVGTEAVIDSVKLVSGFKSKPTALDSVNKLKEWLPGSLEGIGASASAVRQLNKTLDSMTSIMADVDRVSVDLATIDQWLPDALKDLSVGGVQQLLDEKLPALRAQLQAKGASQQALQTVETWVRGALSTIEATTAGELMLRWREALKILNQPDEVITRLLTTLETWLPGVLTNLTVTGAKRVFETAFPELEKKLKAEGVSDASIQQFRPWLEGALHYIERNMVPDIENAYTASLTNLLRSVEERREIIQSPLRKVFRWLKAKVGIVEQTFLRLDRIILPLHPANIARTLILRDEKHRDEEISRLRWMRVISIAVGLSLAVALRVDVGDLLEPIITQKMFIVLTTPFQVLIPGPVGNLLGATTIGIILSGLAASAGSTFWHDVLERLQSSKKAVGEVKDMLDQLRQLESGK